MQRQIATLAIVAFLACFGWQRVSAHAGPRLTDPLEGATLGDTPAIVRLSFSERPEASLSLIRVLDVGGTAYQAGSPQPVPGDPLALSVPVKPLGRGVYIVNWRIISAVDGHVTTGAYAFGVQMSPIGARATSITYPPASTFELISRWTFIAGVVLLVGALSATIAGFGGRGDLKLAASGCLLAMIGVLALVEAQRRTAGVSLAVLFGAAVGRALIWRTALVSAAGVAIAVSCGARAAWTTLRRIATVGAALAALAAIAVHVAAGHAAAGSGAFRSGIVAQWAHFSAAGIWTGGLAALLLGIRGAASDRKAAAARRFSSVAAISLLLVAATGVARTVDELTSWRDLITTAYGRVVVVKMALIAMVAALGAVNRWRSVPAAATDPRLLRRTANGELVLMAAALAAAAALGTLPPSAAVQAGPVGIVVSGADFATTVRARLQIASDQPGPNRFTLSIVDYDSRKPVSAGRVSLRFTPMDDPGVAPTFLQLTRGQDGAFGGAGANMAFDGRWLVTALIERAGDSVEVPLELEARPVWQPYVFVARVPGQATTYTVDVSGGTLRFAAEPERLGRSTLYVTCYDQIGDPRPIEAMVVTSAAPGPGRQLPVQLLSRGRFAAEINLQAGENQVAAIARTADGTRLRAVVRIDVPR